MYKKLLFSIAALALFSCNRGTQFEIEGTITNADSTTIYLESNGIAGVKVIDSLLLDKKGHFSFEQTAPNYPEFYRLRIANEVINIAIDSTETITVTSTKPTFSTAYKIEGNDENEKITLIISQGKALKKQIDDIFTEANKGITSPDSLQKRLNEEISLYKGIITPLILENPRSLASYFAIFQQVNGYDIYDINEKNDRKIYGAVATSYNQYYPDSERSKQLYDMTMTAMALSKKGNAPLPTVNNITDISYFNIELPNIKGEMTKLSNYYGKVILLNFTAYSEEFSPAYNMLLNDLYEKYKSKGFEIFQVSFDKEDNYWKVAAANIPWVCVRDSRGIYSPLFATYNIDKIPTTFLYNKKGDLVLRNNKLEQLSKEIEKIL